MVVTRLGGDTSLTVRGPETKASAAECPANGEWFAIRFKLGTFMPLMRPRTLRDRNDLTLPRVNGQSFWLNGSAWEYPDFENAETFVQRLARAGLIAVDQTIDEVLCGALQPLSTRTVQRRFLESSGITHSTVRQIERARRATQLLRRGLSALDVAHETGYFDQAHLSRSMKRFIGQTPAQIVGAEHQLSFLYNTMAT